MTTATHHLASSDVQHVDPKHAGSSSPRGVSMIAMTFGALSIWIAGLMTAVPYATYFLLFRAQQDEYALLITFVLFWIFGYWGVVGPLIASIRIYAVMRAIKGAQSREKLHNVLLSHDTREAAIDLIASEANIPRFMAAGVYRLLRSHLQKLRSAKARR